MSPNERRKPKNSNDGFKVGSSKPPLAAKGNKAREVHDNGNKGEIRTRRVDMPIFLWRKPRRMALSYRVILLAESDERRQEITGCSSVYGGRSLRVASMGGYTSTFSELGGLQGVVVGALSSKRRRGDVREVFFSLARGYYL